MPGDIVLLEDGSIVPADLRLMKENRLALQEASLTGESVLMEKTARLFWPKTLPWETESIWHIPHRSFYYSRGTSCDGNYRNGAWCTANGEAECDYPKAARSRNTGECDGYLL